MSDPTNQRADGCSVFFTFLVLALLLSGFYLLKELLNRMHLLLLTEAIDSARTAKAQAHRVQNEEFLSFG